MEFVRLELSGEGNRQVLELTIGMTNRRSILEPEALPLEIGSLMSQRELGTILDLKELDDHSRAAVTGRLDLFYFTARITQINAIYEEFHIPKFEVETDRGPRSFEIGSTRRDIRILDGGRILIRDADGNRFEISDYRTLDPISQGMIETII